MLSSSSSRSKCVVVCSSSSSSSCVHTNIVTRHVVLSNAERFVVMPSCPQGVQLPDSRRRRRREKNVAVASNIDSSPRPSSLRGSWSWSGVWCVDIIQRVISGSSSSSSYQRMEAMEEWRCVPCSSTNSKYEYTTKSVWSSTSYSSIHRFTAC